MYRYITTNIDKVEDSTKYLHGLRDDKCDLEVNNIIEHESSSKERFPIDDKFSIILSTYDRPKLTIKMIDNYVHSAYVEHIFVIWHNPNADPPQELMNKTRSKRRYVSPPYVTILKQSTDSLNNKFNPIPKLVTKGVLIAGLYFILFYFILFELVYSLNKPHVIAIQTLVSLCMGVSWLTAP